MRVHCQVGGAGVFVNEQNPLPGLATVRSAKNSPVLRRRKAAAHRSGKDDVRIRGIHDDARDAAGVFEARMLPGGAAIGGLVNAVADRSGDAVIKRLAGARPNNIVRGWGNRQRANGHYVFLIEDRRPAQAAVGRLEDSSGGSPYVIHHGVARLAHDRVGAISFRTESAVAHLRKPIRIKLLRTGRKRKQRNADEHGQADQFEPSRTRMRLVRSIFHLSTPEESELFGRYGEAGSSTLSHKSTG